MSKNFSFEFLNYASCPGSFDTRFDFGDFNFSRRNGSRYWAKIWCTHGSTLNTIKKKYTYIYIYIYIMTWTVWSHSHPIFLIKGTCLFHKYLNNEDHSRECQSNSKNGKGECQLRKRDDLKLLLTLFFLVEFDFIIHQSGIPHRLVSNYIRSNKSWRNSVKSFLKRPIIPDGVCEMSTHQIIIRHMKI